MKSLLLLLVVVVDFVMRMGVRVVVCVPCTEQVEAHEQSILLAFILQKKLYIKMLILFPIRRCEYESLPFRLYEEDEE